jgi:hypothetical protein
MSVEYKKGFGKVIKSMVDGSAAKIIAPIAQALASDIKAVTPVLTGETQASITTRQHSKFGYTIYTPLKKAIFIEFGTEDTPAAKMFRATFDTQAISIATQLEKEFKSLVENVSV